MLSKLFLLQSCMIFLFIFSGPLKAQTQQTFTGWSAAFFTYKINLNLVNFTNKINKIEKYCKNMSGGRNSSVGAFTLCYYVV